MKSQLLFLTLLALLLQACTKNNDPKPSAGNGKLTKVVMTDGSYTTTVLYSYDANGKLSARRQSWSPTQANSGPSGEDGFRIARKSGDMIDKIILKSSGNPDSTTYTTTTTGQQYTAIEKTEIFPYGVQTKRFSFTYDNQGKIAEATDTNIFNGQPDPLNRYNFTYQDNNIISIKSYRISGGTNIPFDEYSFEYDQKVNPIAFSNESILLSFVTDRSFVQSSANNTTKMTVKQISSPFPDIIVTISYTYNDQNMPLKATANSSRATSVQTSLFTYQ